MRYIVHCNVLLGQEKTLKSDKNENEDIATGLALNFGATEDIIDRNIIRDDPASGNKRMSAREGKQG